MDWKRSGNSVGQNRINGSKTRGGSKIGALPLGVYDLRGQKLAQKHKIRFFKFSKETVTYLREKHLVHADGFACCFHCFEGEICFY